MIKIAICDDENYYINMFENEIGAILQMQNRPFAISLFTCASDLIEYCENSNIDVVFLDISMPDISGFEAAEMLRKISKDMIIVFITSHEDMVFQSWEFEPFWFVRKTHIDDMKIVITKLLTKLDAMYTKINSCIQIEGESSSLTVDTEKVIYAESIKHYIIFHNNDGTTERLRIKISDADKQLSPRHFVRIQNGIIVNCRFITRLTSRTVHMEDGQDFSISRARVDGAKNAFQQFVRSRQYV